MLSFAALVLAVLALAKTAAASYDWKTGNTSIWLCAAAYCQTNTYMTRTFKSYTAGFVVTNVLDYPSKDVQVRRLLFYSSCILFPINNF